MTLDRAIDSVRPEPPAGAAEHALTPGAVPPTDPTLRRLFVQAVLDRADELCAQGRYDLAQPLADQGVAYAVRWLGRGDPDTVSAYNSLGLLARHRGDLSSARKAYTTALRGAEACRDTHGTAAVRHNLASLEQLAGRPAHAQWHIRGALALREPGTAGETGDLAVLATILTDLGRLDEAASVYDTVQARQLIDAGGSGGGMDLASLHANRAVLEQRRGNLALAVTHATRAVHEFTTLCGPRHPHTAVARMNLAELLRAQGRFRTARSEARRAARDLVASGAADHPALAMAGEADA